MLDVLPDRGWVWQVQETNRADVVVHPEAEIEEDSRYVEILLLEDDPLRPTIRSGGCLVEVAVNHHTLPLVTVLVVELVALGIKLCEVAHGIPMEWQQSVYSQN